MMYYSVIMHRTQIQLTSAQLDGLRDLAAHQQRSLADIIRESIDLYMAKAATGRDRGELAERAKRAAGRYSSGRADGSTRHDDYLAEAFR
jgi:hypothetical protein